MRDGNNSLMKGKESVKMTRTLKKCQIEHLEIEYIAEVKSKEMERNNLTKSSDRSLKTVGTHFQSAGRK